MKRTSVKVSYSKQINLYAYEPIKYEIESVIESDESISKDTIVSESKRLTALVDSLIADELLKISEKKEEASPE